MLRTLKGVLCAATMLCAAQANAAVSFTLQPGTPLVANVTSTSFFFNVTEQASAPTSYQIVISYFNSLCPGLSGCNPNASALFTRNVGTTPVTDRFLLSGPPDRVTPPTILLTFTALGNTPVNLSNISLEMASFVPEPATWAMMLTGFALTGYALRRRRARVAFA